MGGTELAFEREYEFAPVIVWDALVDPDLLSGWLPESILGATTVLEPRQLLTLETTTVGTLRFELTEVAGGSRGTSTRLSLRLGVEVEPAFAARIKATWLTNLDQLDDLLHGHPVDWANWERDHHDAWTQHLDDVVRGSA
jgi:uncharacterized protein YndB with AHSA1/START domain